MSKHTVKVDNRSLGKLVGGFAAGYDVSQNIKFLPFGDLSLDQTFELMFSVLYDLMHIPLKYGATKEEIYDFTVMNFSLMVDKFLPEKLKEKDLSNEIFDEAHEIIKKRLNDYTS